MAPRHRHWLRLLFRYHRRAGLVAAIIVVVIAGTGIALNHTEGLTLDERHIRLRPVLQWYGMSPEQPPQSFQAGEHRITQIEDRLYLGTEPLPGRYPPLVGAAVTDKAVIAAFADAVALIGRQGALIERMGTAAGTPAAIGAIGKTSQSGVVVRTPQGHYRLGPDLLTWRPTDPGAVAWSRPSPLPAERREALLRHYRGKGLSLERLVLDLHSGRILGAWGRWLWDLAALLLVFLAVTGFGMWAITARAHRRRSH